MSNHPASPDVLGTHPTALPELKHDQRRANLLSRQQFQVRQFLAADYVHGKGFVPDEAGRLLPGPPQHHDHSATVMFDIEVGETAIGRPATFGCESRFRIWPESRLKGFVAPGRTGAHLGA